MLKINIHMQALQPMLDWLKAAKEKNIRSEFQLRQILSMDDYQVEFARYGMEGLPVCGISFEEAVDFFLNFAKIRRDVIKILTQRTRIIRHLGTNLQITGIFL